MSEMFAPKTIRTSLQILLQVTINNVTAVIGVFCSF